MIAQRLEDRRKKIRSQPVPGLVRQDPAAHPVTKHQSFSHSVMFTGANRFRAALAGLLHGRTSRDPNLKPHEHKNDDLTAHLRKGERYGVHLMNKNV